jgi:hypothetical protein
MVAGLLNRMAFNTSTPAWERIYFRSLFGLFSAGYFISHFLFPGIPFREFLVPRLWLSLLPLALFALSFTTPVKNNLTGTAALLFVLVTVHLSGFFFVNGLRTRFEPLVLAMILFSNLHFSRLQHLVIYNVSVLAVLEYLIMAYPGTVNPLALWLFS